MVRKRWMERMMDVLTEGKMGRWNDARVVEWMDETIYDLKRWMDGRMNR